MLAYLSPAQDSLITWSELNFRNEHELSTFRTVQRNPQMVDPIDLFMVHYTPSETISVDAAHKQINDAVSVLLKETESMSETKKVKKIYEYIHQRFFKVYQHDNSFPDVFKNGEYNCVSASAVYAIVLQRMKIPFQIMEAPQHVYLFAYPQSHRILIESTSPKNGYLSFDEAYVQRFINHMAENKLISATEIQSYSARQLFEKYYFNKNGISLHQLAAVQYINYAAYHIRDADYEKALVEAKKGYFLDTCERNNYVLLQLLRQVTANRNYSDAADLVDFKILCRYNQVNAREISKEAITDEFRRLTYTQLIKKSDPQMYRDSYEKIDPELKDSSLKAEVAFIFHYELARVGFLNNKNRKEIFGHLKAAYDLNPKHSDLQGLIKGLLSRELDQSNNPADMMKEIEDFNNQFSFLETDETFHRVRSNCYLESAYQQFALNNAANGETDLKKFEALCKANPNVEPSDRFVEKAYSTAATYYFKKGNKTKTKEVLKRGLNYAPNNFGLKMRLSQVP